VAICGQTIKLKDIQPNTSAAGFYKVTGDSGYTIEVEFQSGKTLRKETGYVTNGMDFQDEITVTDSDIEITDTKASRPSAR
jgi:penicillin V acylase-like amidase (Ntn superfamily)